MNWAPQPDSPISR